MASAQGQERGLLRPVPGKRRRGHCAGREGPIGRRPVPADTEDRILVARLLRGVPPASRRFLPGCFPGRENLHDHRPSPRDRSAGCGRSARRPAAAASRADGDDDGDLLGARFLGERRGHERLDQEDPLDERPRHRLLRAHSRLRLRLRARHSLLEGPIRSRAFRRRLQPLPGEMVPAQPCVCGLPARRRAQTPALRGRDLRLHLFVLRLHAPRSRVGAISGSTSSSGC